MEPAHASAGARAPESSINWINLLTWISVGILLGTEVFGALLAAAWAVGGLLELGPILQYALYALALTVGAAVMLPFMRRAARLEPLRGRSEEAGP